jgi:hypothetical protein
MAEPVDPNDQAERIRRLQERRAGTTNARRSHPAAASRILLAGLSVSSFFTVAGAIALTHRQATPTQSVTAASGTPGAPGSAASSGARPGTATNAVAHTVTKAS